VDWKVGECWKFESCSVLGTCGVPGVPTFHTPDRGREHLWRVLIRKIDIPSPHRHSMCGGNLALAEDIMGSNPGSATFGLCAFEQVRISVED
jgi:hypothetical protein